MALISCPECGRKVSSMAKNCILGHVIPNGGSRLEIKLTPLKWTLIEIARDHEGFKYGLAQNPKTPPNMLAYLYQQSLYQEDFLEILACNENTPPEILEELCESNNYHISDAAYSNPSTPKSIIDQALQRSIREGRVVHGLLGYPLTELQQEALLGLLDSPSFDAFTLSELGRNHHITLKAQNALIDASHINMSSDTGADMRSKLAENECADSQVLALLSRDLSYVVRMRVASNPSAPPSTLMALAKRGGSYSINCFGNPSAPEELLIEATQDPEKGWKSDAFRRAASNPAMPVYRLRELASHPSPVIQKCVARNPSAPEDLLRALAERPPSMEALEGVAGNQSTPGDVLAELSSRSKYAPDNLFPLDFYIAENPSTPPDTLRELSSIMSESWKLKGARYRDISEVRSRTAGNPSTPRDALLEILSTDTSFWGNADYARFARNPSLFK